MAGDRYEQTTQLTLGHVGKVVGGERKSNSPYWGRTLTALTGFGDCPNFFTHLQFYLTSSKYKVSKAQGVLRFCSMGVTPLGGKEVV